MAQADVLKILKNHQNQFLRADEISKIIGRNIQTVNGALKKLLKANDITFKEFIPKKGRPGKTYAFITKDTTFEECLHLYSQIKQESRFKFMSSETVTNLMLLKEMKQLVGMMKDVKSN